MFHYDKWGAEITLMEWAGLIEDHDYKRVGRDTFYEHLPAETLVSTVWLGVSSGFDLDHHQIFETMIFGGWNDGFVNRYFTLEEAEEGHRLAVQAVERGVDLMGGT